MEALVRAQLASTPGATINSLYTTGSGTLSIAGTNATFTYNDFTLHIDLTAEGINMPTTTIANGAFKVNLYLQVTSEFYLDVYSGEGSVIETDAISDGFNINLGQGGGFADQKYRISYQCAPGKLNI